MNLVFVFNGSVGQAIASLDGSSARVSGSVQALVRQEIRPDRTAGSISNPLEWGFGVESCLAYVSMVRLGILEFCSWMMADAIVGVRKSRESLWVGGR